VIISKVVQVQRASDFLVGPFRWPLSVASYLMRLDTKCSDWLIRRLKNAVFWDVTPCSSCKTRRSSETSVLTSAKLRNITEDGILHSHRRENLKSYIALTGWALWRRRNVSPMRYELGFYIPEEGILHSYRRENLKSYTISWLFSAAFSATYGICIDWNHMHTRLENYEDLRNERSLNGQWNWD
jgi:hypothetical protein